MYSLLTNGKNDDVRGGVTNNDENDMRMNGADIGSVTDDDGIRHPNTSNVRDEPISVRQIMVVVTRKNDNEDEKVYDTQNTWAHN